MLYVISMLYWTLLLSYACKLENINVRVLWGIWYVSAGINLCKCPANERWRYTVTPSLIDWAHAQNDPCIRKLDLHDPRNKPLQGWCIISQPAQSRYNTWQELSWWCHDMEILSTLLALCEGNPWVTFGFPLERECRTWIISLLLAWTKLWNYFTVHLPVNWDIMTLMRHHSNNAWLELYCGCFTGQFYPYPSESLLYPHLKRMCKWITWINIRRTRSSVSLACNWIQFNNLLGQQMPTNGHRV